MSIWRPIETAPRDGTWVLLAGGKCYGDQGDNIGRVVSAQWTEHKFGRTHPALGRWMHSWYYDGGYFGEYEHPIYWAPIPEPPK